MLTETEQYRKGTKVFSEGEEAEYVYQVTSGAVRTFTLLSDGRRLINAFHLPGDMFGLENGSAHRFTAEAIVETKVRMTRQVGLVDTMANWTREAGATILDLITRNLRHRTTCFFWVERQRWRRWPHFFTKWTHDWTIRM